MKEMVNRIDYEDKHFDILDEPIPVDVLKYVDKYFHFNYTKVKNGTSKGCVLFTGLKDFGDEPYRITLCVCCESESSNPDTYCYSLSVTEGFYNRLNETGFITPEGRFARIQRNTYV